METKTIFVRSEADAKTIMENKKYQKFIIHDKAIIACLQQNKSLSNANLLYEIELLQSESFLRKLKLKIATFLHLFLNKLITTN